MDNRDVFDRTLLLVTNSGPVRAGRVGDDLVLNNQTFTGRLNSGAWVNCPTTLKLRLNGTGTLILDARSPDDIINYGVGYLSIYGADNQAEFLYPGEATQVRVTLSGTLTAEIL